MMHDELKDDLLTNYADESLPLSSGWLIQNTPNWLNDTGTREITEIYPCDAKTVEEVESFTVKCEVKGHRFVSFTRLAGSQ
jgi:hypothetical protein